MANAISNVLTLRRRKNTFTPRGETEPVTYFEALLLDVDTEELVVFRSRDEADFEPLEKGKIAQGFESRVDGATQVNAQLLRPTREGAAGFGGSPF